MRERVEKINDMQLWDLSLKDRFLYRLEKFFHGKSVLILGFGREGRSTLELIKDWDCEIGIADINLPADPELSCYDLYTGENYLDCLEKYDIIMKTPGIALLDKVPPEIKERITGQTDLLLRFCENKIIGITGTKGKSTTSSLIAHILNHCGKKALLVGNIGIPPLSQICELTDDTAIVCEMSCHQLEYVSASPDIGVLLNIFEEHLDHYTGFAAYRYAKENIYRYMKKDSALIYNKDCENSEILSLPGVKISASSKKADSEKQECDIYIEGDNMHIYGISFPLSYIHTSLAGEHNLYNISVAIACALRDGCALRESLAAIQEFHGLAHRLEPFATINGVTYVDDSISTIPEAAIAAVKAFNADTLIIGGMDRGISYDILVNYLSSNESCVKNVIALPDSGWRVADMLSNVNVLRVNNLEEAAETAYQTAEHCCLLSPAAASYGFFKNFEERGDRFKELVKQMEEKC